MYNDIMLLKCSNSGIREGPFDFNGGGGILKKKIIRTVIRTIKIDRMTKQTKKYPGRCEKRRARKCQKTNGHKLTFDI